MYFNLPNLPMFSTANVFTIWQKEKFKVGLWIKMQNKTMPLKSRKVAYPT